MISHTFRDKALQLYCSFPPYSITYFQQLANALIQHFQNIIDIQITLTGLFHCKQGVKEKND